MSHHLATTTIGTCACLIIALSGCVGGGTADPTSLISDTNNPADELPPWDGNGDPNPNPNPNPNPDPQPDPEVEPDYADAVISYDPTFGGNNPQGYADARDPNAALGEPDYDNSRTRATTLNSGGLLEVAFTDNVLLNSGDSDADLVIVETDDDGAEAVELALRPDDATAAALEAAGHTLVNGWVAVGKIDGGTQQIDIDATFADFDAGALRFTGVRVIDDLNDGPSGGNRPGADIDAIGALSSEPTS